MPLPLYEPSYHCLQNDTIWVTFLTYESQTMTDFPLGIGDNPLSPHQLLNIHANGEV